MLAFLFVIAAQAGIQVLFCLPVSAKMDTGLRRYDRWSPVVCFRAASLKPVTHVAYRRGSDITIECAS